MQIKDFEFRYIFTGYRTSYRRRIWRQVVEDETSIKVCLYALFGRLWLVLQGWWRQVSYIFNEIFILECIALPLAITFKLYDRRKPKELPLHIEFFIAFVSWTAALLWRIYLHGWWSRYKHHLICNIFNLFIMTLLFYSCRVCFDQTRSTQICRSGPRPRIVPK